MREDFGPTFVTITDDNGQEIVLEFLDALEYEGIVYQAFFPAEVEGEAENPDNGLVILKVIHENGEDLLSTPDSDEELQAVYDRFILQLFDDDDDDDNNVDDADDDVVDNADGGESES